MAPNDLKKSDLLTEGESARNALNVVAGDELASGSRDHLPVIEGIRSGVVSKTSMVGIDSDDSRITKYLADSLSDSEKRIGVPINENCKACVVVPAYGERGYIFRPLLSLAQQKNVSPDEYELIVVVNNPPEEPKQALNETKNDYQRKLAHYRVAVDENQAVINLIKKINGENVDVVTTSEEDGMMEAIRASGLKIHVIDKSSEGETLPASEANVGGARNRGVAEAVLRFCSLKKDGIIGQSDADTRFSENYVRRLIDVFNSDPAIVGIEGRLEFEEEEGNDSELMRLVTDSVEMSYVHDRLFESLWKIEFDEGGGDVAQDLNIGFSGANMASRAYVAALVGGVQKIPGGEDTAFGMAISKAGKVVRDEKLVTMPANRFSPRTDVNAGHGQRLFKKAEKLGTGEGLTFRSYKRAKVERELMQKIGIAISTGNISVENLRSVLSFSGEALLSDNEFSELSEILGQAEGLGAVARLVEENPRLNELKNKALGRFDKLFPELSLADSFAEIEGVFLEQTNKREKYEHEINDISLDFRRYKFIVSFLESGDLGEGTVTREDFLAKLRAYNLTTYDELSSGPTTWDGSMFVGEMFELVKRGTDKEAILANVKSRFRCFSFLANSSLADQIIRFFAMELALSKR